MLGSGKPQRQRSQNGLVFPVSGQPPFPNIDLCLENALLLPLRGITGVTRAVRLICKECNAHLPSVPQGTRARRSVSRRQQQELLPEIVTALAAMVNFY
ncbi:hypothetical protein NDU88_005300 [Pleurodeles waltl]|uniref:Uncharacterized protein n=1 Tax=Pleurodeles waltl TaxID=8319 RepID=A0AAV7PI61_PLEWA|nr:hypothetical protein NDU88_005300 [Pleurodeles waltl]